MLTQNKKDARFFDDYDAGTNNTSYKVCAYFEIERIVENIDDKTTKLSIKVQGNLNKIIKVDAMVLHDAKELGKALCGQGFVFHLALRGQVLTHLINEYETKYSNHAVTSRTTAKLGFDETGENFYWRETNLQGAKLTCNRENFKFKSCLPLFANDPKYQAEQKLFVGYKINK